jgi:hypothetical protein
MKKFILYLILLFAVFSATAQTDDAVNNTIQNPKKEEKIQALYIAYITQQLSLTTDEAQKFWPVHAQYEAELKNINQGNAGELDRQQAVLNVKKKYQGNFSKILGSERSNNFYRQDGEFRKKLVERLKQMRQQRKMENNNNGGGARLQRGGRVRPQQ